ncbi:Uu.00g100930.m01.CDS01 [Anthostomella pinea]|uniref:EGF domain-specific O-linked N-acetylglucosamine transferase n=1 Tax=Anthostomella pinea TaxID=933095 RepID=A0AAI8YFH6_9PEZI|nr:Uu.00g100930.m01.CDS01 [Anthostomella pinea]
MLNRRSWSVSALVLVAISLFLTLLTGRIYLSHNISSWPRPHVVESPTRLEVSAVTAAKFPLEYYPNNEAEDVCSRYSPTYLDDFRALTASYCEPASPAKLTCFHRSSGFNKVTDSFCFAQGAVLDTSRGRFQLDCALRQLSQEEQDDGILPFDRLPAYWYETGPANVFSLAVDVNRRTSPPLVDSEAAAKVDKATTRESTPAPGLDTTPPVTSQTPLPSPKKLLLLKREGEGNPWHCLMEIFSTYMTFDILRMSGDSAEGHPLFQDPEDSYDTQVVILDSREDGPYFDLWTLFSRRKPLRIHQLLGDRSMANSLKDVDLIVPLAGSSNPFWKDDERAEQCTQAPILDVFSRRVLEFYGVEEPLVRQSNKPIVVTFVNRRESRRLHKERYLLAELQRRDPHIDVRMVDFAALPFSEQVRVARETDVLVGVHGAGLTHSMFLRPGAAAVVEIQPNEMDHKGFRNIAGMRGLGYFRVHSNTISPEDWREGEEEIRNSRDETGGHATEPSNESSPLQGRKSTKYHQRRAVANHQDDDEADEIAVGRGLRRRDGWHLADVEIEEDRFFEVVEAATKYMYNKGPWGFDVN